jgi:hypothetical protein
MSNTSVSFLTIAAFKKAIGADKVQVVFNKNSNKLSVLADEGEFYRCQQNIDLNSRMAFLVPDGELDNACLVNVKGDGTSPLSVQADL